LLGLREESLSNFAEQHDSLGRSKGQQFQQSRLAGRSFLLVGWSDFTGTQIIRMARDAPQDVGDGVGNTTSQVADVASTAHLHAIPLLKWCTGIGGKDHLVKLPTRWSDKGYANAVFCLARSFPNEEDIAR